MKVTRDQAPNCHPCDFASGNDSEDQMGHRTNICPGPMSESLAYVNVLDSSRLEHAGGWCTGVRLQTGLAQEFVISGVSSRVQGTETNVEVWRNPGVHMIRRLHGRCCKLEGKPICPHPLKNRDSIYLYAANSKNPGE